MWRIPFNAIPQWDRVMQLMVLHLLSTLSFERYDGPGDNDSQRSTLTLALRQHLSNAAGKSSQLCTHVQVQATAELVLGGPVEVHRLAL